MYSFFVKPTVNKKTMGLIHSVLQDSPFTTTEADTTTMMSNKNKRTSNESKTGPALFTLNSVSNDIEYPTSNSILKTEDFYKSETFTSELYESCILSFSIVQIKDNILVGLNNKDKYYGIKFQNDKYRIVLNDSIESEVDTFPDEREFNYEIGDNFKIIHLSNEINIFKNEYKIYTSNKKKRENDSYRALFILSNKDDEIRNIQFYYTHQESFNCMKQGSKIVSTNSVLKTIKISDGDSFYLLEGVSSVISGMSKGKNGQRIIIVNNSGNKQTFLDNNIDSLPENRLCLGVNKIELKDRTSIQFLYISDLNKWVLL